MDFAVSSETAVFLECEIMSYKIITDSCCDFTDQMCADLDVRYAPLIVSYSGESHTNFSEETAIKAFYNELRNGVTATTSAVNPEGWATVMEPVLKEGHDLLVITFTSAKSTTYQSAVIAANELLEQYPDRKIQVVDSLCAALGQGLLVWYACQKRDEGMGLEELTAWVEETKLSICHWVTVDDLSHLKRGGRISATSAIVGTMLNIKPIIHVNDEGRLINVAKVRGRKTAINYLADKLGELGEGFNNDTCFVVHGDCEEDAQVLANMVKEKYGVKNVHIGYLGPVIGAHTGPGVLALFFMGEHR